MRAEWDVSTCSTDSGSAPEHLNLTGVDRAPMQAFLTKLLTVDLPGLIVLPRRLDVNIPPSVGAVAEAAVGRDAVMRAIASAVLQALDPFPAAATASSLLHHRV